MVRVSFDDRAELLAAAPDIYYVTDHYVGYTAVLVRLSRITPDVLRDLLGMAHKFVTARSSRVSPAQEKIIDPHRGTTHRHALSSAVLRKP